MTSPARTDANLDIPAGVWYAVCVREVSTFRFAYKGPSVCCGTCCFPDKSGKDTTSGRPFVLAEEHLMGAHKYTEEERRRVFWCQVAVHNEDECWPWVGRVNKDGYGDIWNGHTNTKCHRYAYALEVGAIPQDKCVLHTCDNPRCVNPKHLFIGTHADNVNDRVRKGRSAKGEQNGFSKLRADDVKQIRAMYARGGLTYRQIGSIFGVCEDLIYGIVTHRRWKHVP